MWYAYPGWGPQWMWIVLQISGIAFGLLAWGRIIKRRVVHRAETDGETRTYYVVCPRCGRRRNRGYRVGGDHEPRERYR